jgi:hypothetical protein
VTQSIEGYYANDEWRTKFFELDQMLSEAISSLTSGSISSQVSLRSGTAATSMTPFVVCSSTFVVGTATRRRRSSYSPWSTRIVSIPSGS